MLPWLLQNRAIRLEENKVEFLQGQFRSEKLSFFHKKRKLSILDHAFHRLTRFQRQIKVKKPGKLIVQICKKLKQKRERPSKTSFLQWPTFVM